MKSPMRVGMKVGAVCPLPVHLFKIDNSRCSGSALTPLKIKPAMKIPSAKR